MPSARATPENLAAELAAMLHTGVTIEACRKSAAICSLAITQAKASSNEPNDLAVAANHLIREACASVDGLTEGPTAVLLAVAPGYRGTRLKKRREDAAGKLFISALRRALGFGAMAMPQPVGRAHGIELVGHRLE